MDVTLFHNLKFRDLKVSQYFACITLPFSSLPYRFCFPISRLPLGLCQLSHLKTHIGNNRIMRRIWNFKPGKLIDLEFFISQNIINPECG